MGDSVTARPLSQLISMHDVSGNTCWYMCTFAHGLYLIHAGNLKALVFKQLLSLNRSICLTGFPLEFIVLFFRMGGFKLSENTKHL